jgi:hypothetical protein
VVALRLALLVVSMCAIGAAASRVAALAAPRGLLRAIAAVVLGAAAIVGHALLLGLVSLGTTPLVLAAAALATWGAVRRLTGAPATSLSDDARTWWGGADQGWRVATAAFLGGLMGWLVWLWRWPFVGHDGMLQNLLEVNRWIHLGTPGSQHRVFGIAPIESFPLTNDVAIAWLASFGRSFAVIAPWTLTSFVLLVTSLATVLGLLEVPRLVTAAVVAALVTVPHAVALVNSPKTDVPSLAWLAACAALALGAREHPRLLAVALLAAGLSVGSKPTTAPIVGVVVLAALWTHRRALRPLAAPLVAGVLGATAIGGVWYLRNLAQHGSPLWPLQATPWGDPKPPLFQFAGSTFLEDPRSTLAGQLTSWAGVAAGGLVLAPVGVLVALVARDRASRAVGLLGLLAVALWLVSPVTGVDNLPLAKDVLTSTTRYLMPVMGLGAVGLGLLARQPRWRVPVLVLAGALVIWNLGAVSAISLEVMPSPLYLLAGAVLAVGAAIVLTNVRQGGKRPAGRTLTIALPALLIVALAGGVLVARDGWMGRHRQVLYFGGTPIDQLLSDERYVEGEHPVQMTNIAWSDLAGDDLAHDVVLLDPQVTCDELEAMAADSWLVLMGNAFLGDPDLPLQRGCLQGLEPIAEDVAIKVFAPTGQP